MSDREDKTSFFGELKRMARTSGAVGGIAARVAGERVFGIKTNRADHAGDLKTILGGLKGPLMKVAQFLSTVPDALPEEYAVELAQLQANAPAMGAAFVRRRMQGELGLDWQKHFSTFGQEAAAAASLGQVHRATLPDGREVACKLQYPDMTSTVEADLRQLRLAMAVYHRIDSAIQHDESGKTYPIWASPTDAYLPAAIDRETVRPLPSYPSPQLGASGTAPSSLRRPRARPRAGGRHRLDQAKRLQRRKVLGRDAGQVGEQHLFGLDAVNYEQQVALGALFDEPPQLHFVSPCVGLGPDQL